MNRYYAPNQSRTVHRTANVWLSVALLLGGFAWLALHLPKGSLWYDEALTTYVATDSWQTLIRWCTQVDIQVPFHYAVLRLWSGTLGDSEFALRLLSAVCILLASAGLVAIGRQLGRQFIPVGYVAAGLLILQPGMLWLGYEVRAYALALALFSWATAILCALIQASSSPRHAKQAALVLAYSVLMLAALYTHYTAIAGFAAHLVIIGTVIIVRRSRSLLVALVSILVLVGIGFLPWLPVLLTRGAADRSYYVGGAITPDRSVAVMLGFLLLGREDAPAFATPLVIGFIALIILGALLSLRQRRWPAALTGIMIAVIPVFIIAVVVYFKPKLAGRYAWPAWIGFDLLLGLLVIALMRWRRTAGVIALVVIIGAPWAVGAAGGFGQPPDSDFRAAYAYLCTHGDPSDIVILRDGTLFVVDRYYGTRPPCDSPRFAIGLPVAEMTDINQALTLITAQTAMNAILARKPANVWVISWQGDVMDPQGLAYGLLDGNSDHNIVARMFGDVRLDRYAAPHPRPNLLSLFAGQTLSITPVAQGPTLVSLDLIAPDIVKVGDTIVLQAWWLRGATLQPNLRVSARIGSLAGGEPYVQVDQPPSAWKYVDDRWQAGIPSLGRYELAVTSAIPPGRVAVSYVLYDANGSWQPQIINVGEVTVTASGN